MGDFDPAFVQDIEHRPKVGATIVEAEGIPLINLSALYDDSTENMLALEALVDEVRSASKDWGFFQVINHGVPPEKLRKVEEVAKEFFGQPVEDKRKIRRDDTNPLGYFDSEHTKNVRDWKEVFDVTAQNPTLIPASHRPEDDELTQWSNKWPDNLPQLREACEEYVQEMEKLGFRLMELIALSLGLSAKRFHGFFEDHQTSFLRINHYPPCPAPHLALGVARHKDSGALTILAQDDVGGLEVKRKSDGQWIGVKPTPDAYIINIGDILQAWSNEAYESVEHRVMVNSEKERYSIPFFFNPAHYTMVEPLKELVTEENPAKYRPYNWGKFIVTKKRSNFMKLDVDNIQVRDFRIDN